jgi:hemerythrin superfamily protein
LTLLREDHQEAMALFDAFDRAATAAQDDRRQELAQRLCELLTVHAQIEEEIFYPAVRAAIIEHDLLDDGEVEHAMAKELIEQVQAMDVQEALFDAKVRVLAEYVRHHAGIEEDELFGLVELAGVDLDRLGLELAARRHELLGTDIESAV